MAWDYVFSDGTDTQRFRTEKEAICTFCEVLLDDSTSRHPQYPVGTKLEITKGDEVLLSYTVGYSSAPRAVMTAAGQA